MILRDQTHVQFLSQLYVPPESEPFFSQSVWVNPTSLAEKWAEMVAVADVAVMLLVLIVLQQTELHTAESGKTDLLSHSFCGWMDELILAMVIDLSV